jgi:hypothetical protein
MPTIGENAMRTAIQSCGCGFEQLEGRQLLAFATFVSAAASTTALAVVVDYTGINQASIGPGDITFVTTGRAPIAATSVTNITQRPNGVVRVSYAIPAYDLAWGSTDTGAYTISSPPGAVVDGLGHDLAFPDLAQVWLWFGQPKARFISQQVRPTDWLVTIQYDSLNGINEATLDGNDIVMTGATASSKTVSQIIHVSATTIKVVYSIGAPGGAWSFANNGTYTLSLANAQVADNSARQATGHFLASYWLWFATPRAEFVGFTTGTTDWTVQVKFTANPDTTFNPASLVGNGAVYATGPKGYFEPGQLLTAVLNPDGSYTAGFRFVANGGSWDWTDNGTYTVKVAADRARDTDQRPVPASTLATPALTFTAPAAQMILPTSPTRTRWDIDVDFSDEGSIDQSSITTASIRVIGPGGIEMPLSIINIVQMDPHRTRVTFHILQAQGFENGGYTVFVNDQGVRDAQANPVAENALASFWLWF